ncbi:MAG: hypothetical protein M3281_06695 [Chloroflexota bacterium]|nr:hypothetical protein [Chloroflexota bacterium]
MPAARRGASMPPRLRRPPPTAKESTAASSIRLLATLGSPVAVGAALLFYFGWRRTDAQANELGFDASVMGLTSQDYVLKSVNVLYVPALLVLLSAVLARWAHERLVLSAGHGASLRPGVLRWARALQWSWVGWLLLAVVLSLLPGTRALAVPVALTGAVTAALYGGALEQRITGSDSSGGHSAVRGLLWGVLLFAVFWDVERIALLTGEAYARDIITGCSPLAVAVSLYSGRDLALDLPGVERTTVGEGQDARYRFRYDGLLLLQQSGSRYVLINRDWDRERGRVTVLEDSEDLRLEFLDTACAE